jgi:2-succinyl-5-enolpyruvyl-6-hydroxy-3-cyclohexene-1-carboxylate synthase
VVAGDGIADPAAVVAFAETAGWPLLAEPTSTARYGPNAIPAYPLLLPVIRDRLRPEAIVTFGRPTLSREVLAGYDDTAEHTVVHPGRGWYDPTRTAARLVRGPVTAEPHAGAGPGRWLTAWRDAGATAATALDEVLDRTAGLGELPAARDLAAALPSGTMVYAGASLPIRHLDVAMAPRRGLHLLTNRGLSGIDGAVSTLLGAALVGPGRAVGLLGDLTLLHDQNGLLAGPAEPRPDATIVVLNNNGGGLFAHLPYRGVDGFERLFGTPPGAVLEAVATASGWPYRRVGDRAELLAALDRPGLVEIVTDRAATVAAYAEARAAVAAALAT